MQETRTRTTHLVVAAVALAVFVAVVAQILADGPLVDFDHRVADHYRFGNLGRSFLRVQLAPQSRLEPLARIVTPFGDAFVVTVAIAVGAWLLLTHSRRREASFLVTVGIGGIVVNTVTRVVIGHIRPGMPYPYSLVTRFCLPSGHALDATVFYGALLIIAWPRLSASIRVLSTAGVIGLVAAVAASRVVLVAHFVSDVIAGVALGVAWLMLVAAAFSLPSRDGNRLPQAA